MFKNLIQKLRLSLLPLVCLIITCTIALMYIYEPLFLKYLNRKLFDVFLEKVHSTQTTGVPFIVDVDEASLNEFGQWPWPRYRVAQLLVKIQNAGAKVVALDMLFAEADRTSLGVLKQNLKNDLKVNVQFTDLPDALLDNDRILANIIAKGPFVLGNYFYFHKSAQQSANPFLHSLNLAIIKTTDVADSTGSLIEAQSVLPTIRVLAEKAISSGFINTMSDKDGILRSTPLLLTRQGQIYPSLALAALWIAFDQPAGALKMSSAGVESLRLGKLSIPLDQNGRLLLHFRGPRRTFPYISATDVLKDKLKPLSLAGKIVLCEKPMGINQGDAQSIVDVCRTAGVSLTVAYYRRFWPVVQKMKALLAEGAIGRVVSARVQLADYFDGDPNRLWLTSLSEAGGGALANAGSHWVDLIRYLLGEVTEVMACSSSTAGFEVEDTATAIMRTETEAIVSFSSTWQERVGVNDFDICGTHGRILASPLSVGRLQLFRFGKEREIFELARSGLAHHELIQELISRLQTGRSSPVPGEEAVAVWQIIEAAHRSNAEGCRIRIE